MKYLSASDVLLIHSLLIDEVGGSHGIRDHDRILSAVQTPRQKVFGKELHSSVYEKAAVYAYHIMMFHPFVDGNKRTGMIAAIVFLENNNYVFTARAGEVERFAIAIVNKRYDIPIVARWLRRHTQ